MRILIAEDEPHIAQLILFKLKKEGFDATCAQNGRQALEFAITAQWDLIVLDVMMPFLDGWEVLQEIRESQIGTEVLMLTAHVAEQAQKQKFNPGATRFLAKPFDLKKFIDVIREIELQNKFETLVDEVEEYFGEYAESENQADHKSRRQNEMSDPDFVDPALMTKLQSEYKATFPARRKELQRSREVFKIDSGSYVDASAFIVAKNTLRLIAHNLAGVSLSYGFPRLGQVAMSVDAELALEEKDRSNVELLGFIERIDFALASVYETGFDIKSDAKQGVEDNADTPVTAQTPTRAIER